MVAKKEKQYVEKVRWFWYPPCIEKRVVMSTSISYINPFCTVASLVLDQQVIHASQNPEGECRDANKTLGFNLSNTVLYQH